MIHETQLVGITQEPSRLQRELIPKIAELLRHDGARSGGRVSELGLARRLQVSRTPVRAALDEMARRGLLVRRDGGGFTLGEGLWTAPAPPAPPDDVDLLCVRIARDRMAGRLPTEASEADLMRRYEVARAFLLRVLSKLSEVALAERKPGRGWSFSPTVDDPQARDDSYAFRLLIEPQALLIPGFRLGEGWVRDMRERHRGILDTPWRETSSIALFETNAAFHEGLAAASGNRYLLAAIQQQTRLRRFSNYDWSFGFERVVASCTEHIEILDRLERDENDVASALLRRHLETARGLRPSRSTPA